MLLVFTVSLQYILVAHCQVEEADAVVNNELSEVVNMTQFFFGPVDKWDADFLDLDGFDDMLELLFKRVGEDPAALVLGFEQQTPLFYKDIIDMYPSMCGGIVTHK
eukprot:Colp12_sorted_trinity150504_noHs@27309